ncbi:MULTISPECIES: hypothetical protein [Bacteroidaceae]|jgi:hypothetical protein|uniref:hypothetical protein n=1 Tax=Bacteroidaceae TaxID=815 RepID=UPI000ADD3FFB|nr:MULTISPECIES: hypothetical protein [Bacteroides]UVX95384.1 MAG: hypothetical protein [Bacteriophage sp.]DAI35371.1 MAG TPA: hypothetical protein [Caudoviricetes sp.]MCY6361125.1 hypothetical protein [Bacteroides thetaiotaomicron]MDC2194142.1 hypothetical protein [Bacteroides thetaiotaomicron]MDO6186355.1 hypothetical protein [Bacteroides thetaiotaomicron]
MKRFKARLYDRTIKYTQKQTKFNSGQMNGQCGGFIRLLLTAYSFSELEVSVKCLLPIS